jgi:hypothetical protein
MAALLASGMGYNRRARRGCCLSDKIALSDIANSIESIPPMAARTFATDPQIAAAPVGEPKFLGFNALRGRSEHSFGIPIHNLWDKKIRNLWDSSIIYGTASQTSRCLAGRGSFRG